MYNGLMKDNDQMKLEISIYKSNQSNATHNNRSNNE